MLRSHSLLACVLLFFSTNIYSQEIISLGKRISSDNSVRVTTSSLSSNSATLNVEVPALYKFKKENEGKSYTHLAIEGFGNITDIGHPALPAKSFHMALANENDCKINIIESEIKVLDGEFEIFPALELYKDLYQGEGVPDEEPPFTTDESIYKSDKWYPESPVFITETQIYRGIPVAVLRVVPVQYNPVKKKIRVFRNMVVNVSTSAVVSRKDNSLSSSKILSRLTLNGENIKSNNGSRADLMDESYDYLILTIPDFKEAADSLAVWKKMQGYDVKVDSRSSWTSSSVDNAVKSFYSENNQPEYVLFLGDDGQIPGEVLDADHTTDLYYVCMDGSSDYRPDMARGRIPVNDLETAFDVVNKILKYDRTPVTDPGFYKRFTACAQFQDDDKNGYADRRFSLTAEDMVLYMEDQGYESERIYKTSTSITPTNWNSGNYAFGQAIPSYLRKPGFPWDGDRYDIRNAIERGTFLLLHRDHGYTSGWGTPAYNTTDVEQLTNGDLTPVVLSLNCLTGKFKSYCFSEGFLRNANGGAVAVFGAMEVSFSGTNDAFCHGLFDAMYPGTEIYSPKNTTVNPEDHDPIYNLGDVLVHGLWAMERANYRSKATHELMHYFGDPALEIRTATPFSISVDHVDRINVKDESFELSNMSITSGYATIYDKVDGEVIGKVKIESANETITFNKPLDKSDSLVLTIYTHNCIPYIKDLEIIANPSTFIISKPEKGQLFDVGDEIKIEWTTEGVTVSNVKIEMSKDNGNSFSIIESSISNSGSYSFNAPDNIDSDQCYFKLIDVADTVSNNLSKIFSIFNISDVSGTVKEMTPAEVYYTGVSDGSASTSTDGKFSINDMYPGEYSFYAISGIYSSDTVKLVLPPDTTNFDLEILFPKIATSKAEVKITLEPGDTVVNDLGIENEGTEVLSYISCTKNSTARILINEIFTPKNAFIDGIELWNRGGDLDLTGWKVVWNDNTETSAEYEFEDGYTIGAGKTIVLMDDDSLVSSSMLYMGLNVAWSCEDGTELSVALINSDGLAVDFFRSSEGSAILPDGAFWDGDGVEIDSISERVYRNKDEDNDNASDWSTGSGEQSVNSINSGQSATTQVVNWLTLQNSSSAVSVQSSKDIKLHTNTVGLNKGTYRDTILVIHDAPNVESQIKVPVTLLVKDLFAPLSEDIDTSTNQNTSISLELLGEDSDGSVIGYMIDSEPGSGTVTLNGSEVIYDPKEGFIGIDEFKYLAIDDDSLKSNPSTVMIDVKPIVAITDKNETKEIDMPFVVGPNPASISKNETIDFIINDKKIKGISIEIYDYQNNLLDSFRSSNCKGNVYSWDLKNKYGAYVAIGEYLAILKVTKRDGSTKILKQYLAVIR